ncbi:MAG: hypothetical protein HRT61_18530 [Ekhidna sp.]|nr:hypothetical protein [Ekhidna sp.]
MKEGIIKDTYELLIKELQTIISISYITIVGIGMLFNYHKYEEFGINIFEYADIFDFLIAPFSDFQILLFSTFSLLFVATLFRLDGYMMKKYPKAYSKFNFGRDKKPWYIMYRNAMFALSFFLYLYVAAEYYGSYAKQRVVDKDPITINFIGDKSLSGKLIGKTKDVIFILKGKTVSALPISSSVREIQVK